MLITVSGISLHHMAPKWSEVEKNPVNFLLGTFHILSHLYLFREFASPISICRQFWMSFWPLLPPPVFFNVFFGWRLRIILCPRHRLILLKVQPQFFWENVRTLPSYPNCSSQSPNLKIIEFLVFNSNWHEGGHFYLLVLFGSDFVSWILIFPKIFGGENWHQSG